jgi:hypothetical protein
MLCAICGAEIGDAVNCPDCCPAVDPNQLAESRNSSTTPPTALFSAAWLELRVRSVFVNSPRGFSERLTRISERLTQRRAPDAD